MLSKIIYYYYYYYIGSYYIIFITILLCPGQADYYIIYYCHIILLYWPLLLFIDIIRYFPVPDPDDAQTPDALLHYWLKLQTDKLLLNCCCCYLLLRRLLLEQEAGLAVMRTNGRAATGRSCRLRRCVKAALAGIGWASLAMAE